MAKPVHIEPPYYRDLTPEPIQVIEGWGLGYSLSSVIKYISRAGKKPGNTKLEDLLKARYFLDREILRTETTLAESDNGTRPRRKKIRNASGSGAGGTGQSQA